ncbi:phosphatase PAP2 family protein [Calothrix rhizosoleniae]|uniref:phosphatase PAP2 family protein n=1 Tax=Calothrix rhizosoleniae TaxID=888997 RepID=UPI000B497E37|nr:phosphatase PAP2 family protein [Calothrix rhizosoleniae]
MAAIKWIQSLLGEQWQQFFLAITYLGSEYAYIVFMTLYYWLINPMVGRQLGIITSLSLGCNILLKDIFFYPRPFELEANLASPAAQLTARGSSFPSGHSQGTATFWLFLGLYYQRLWLWTLGTGIVVLVGLSRLYLGVHFPVDVGVGLLLGIFFAVLGVGFSLLTPTSLVVKVVIVVFNFLLAIALPNLARPLGVLLGFVFSNPRFRPPSTWKGRLFFIGVGLPLVLLVHQGISWILGDFSDISAIIFCHYAFLTLFATELLPRMVNK